MIGGGVIGTWATLVHPAPHSPLYLHPLQQVRLNWPEYLSIAGSNLLVQARHREDMAEYVRTYVLEEKNRCLQTEIRGLTQIDFTVYVRAHMLIALACDSL